MMHRHFKSLEVVNSFFRLPCFKQSKQLMLAAVASVTAFTMATTNFVGFVVGLSDNLYTEASAAVTAREVEQELAVMRNTFTRDYAPRVRKREYYSWNAEQAVQKSLQELMPVEKPNMNQIRQSVLHFLKSTRDYHVNGYFYSTENASLPFIVRSAVDYSQAEHPVHRYFLVEIDRAKLNESIFPFQVGDELLSFDQKPVDQEIEKIRQELGETNVGITDQGLAELFLTKRIAARALSVQHGPITVEFRSRNQSQIQSQGQSTKQAQAQTVTRQLIWDYQPENVPLISILSHSISQSEAQKLPTPLRQNEQFTNLSVNEWLRPQMLTDWGWGTNWMITQSVHKAHHSLDGGDSATTTPADIQNIDSQHAIGSRRGFLPTLGKIFWQTDEKSEFHAYIFQTDDHRFFGYVRIPSYIASESESAEFQKIIAEMEDKTEALIIDEQNNPGGSVFYLYSLVSMLITEPARTPLHRMALTPQDLLSAREIREQLENVKSNQDARSALGETIDGYPVDYQLAQFFLSYAGFVIDSWHKGERLTEPYFLGIDQINPHPNVHYSKPILVLVNELDFSGGDFFPAILQDNRRAKIMGTRTAGAGGYVRQARFPNSIGLMMFTYTASIAERVDKNPIENLGVTPDIPYEISVKDRQDNYSEFVQAILRNVKEIAASKN